MEQPFDNVDEIYNQKLGEVLHFFSSRLQPYYSSSRLTLLLTILGVPHHLRSSTVFQANVMPLPSRLRAMDQAFLSFSTISHCPPEHWSIFRDFMDSGHPLALDGQRYATAALACLKLIFNRYQVPLSSFRRFSRHSLTPNLGMYVEHFLHRNNVHLPVWEKFLRPYLSTHMCRGIPGIHVALDSYQRSRAIHLQFLLEKSAYSDSLLTFTRRRVFRFGYLQRNHPTYMKKAIFALAKYIHRVTGETTEVMACESIWGRNGWFSAD